MKSLFIVRQTGELALSSETLPHVRKLTLSSDNSPQVRRACLKFGEFAYSVKTLSAKNSSQVWRSMLPKFGEIASKLDNFPEVN